MRSRNPDARRIHPARRSPGASASPRRAAALLAGCLLAGALAAGPPIAASSPPAEPAPVADFRLGVEDGLPSIYPTCALRDRVGFLWICTDRGLTRWDGHRALVLEHDPADGRSLSSARVHRLLQDRSNHLWVGTDSGLDRFDRESLEFQRYPIDDVASGVGQRRVTAMEEAAPGRFWVGTLGGLYLFDSRDRSYAAVEALRGLTVRSLALDRRGALWAATAQGVFTVESRLEARPALEQSPELGEAAVLSLAVDSEDRLWLGTDRGVWRVDLPSSGEAVHLPGTRGAVTDLAFGVRGSSLFYAASRLGLFRASRSGSSPPARLGPAEGWLAFDSDSGIAWSSGQGAVLGFQAEAAARTRARVIFTGLEIDGQPVLPGAGDGLIARDISTARSLDLPGEFRRLAIDLSTLDLAGLDDSRFVYRLVGFGDPWHATGGRWARAVYGPLPPGEYTLEVKAASGVGPEGETLWSEARTLALNVRQLKGGWRTWAVLGALAAVIAGLVVRARSSRRRQTRALDLRLRELQQQKLESLSTLAGGVAHDFNNLLVGIFGHAELAKLQLPEDSPATQHLERIVASGRRAAELAKQMLFYSGRGNFLIEPLDVSSLAQEVGDSLRSSLPDGVQLLVEASPRVPPLEGDPGQLRQVLTHLVTNAAESLEDREGFIVIGTGVRLVDEAFLREHGLADRLTVGEYVTLTVDDTGRGIDEESLERIFEPFFSTKSAGRGLGLAASQGIARGHGGVLRVSSSPGRGSSFQLLLPAMVHPEPEQASAGAEQPAAESRGQILVIDPDGAARQLAREHFARLGFEVLEATDGASALAAFGRSRERLALVLLDVAASQGAEALEILRALRRLEPALPVVLGTELPEAEAAERYAEAQPAGFARKPYKLAHLERVVRSKIASHPVS